MFKIEQNKSKKGRLKGVLLKTKTFVFIYSVPVFQSK